ncbi:uncharacterized protein BT62DRAFT_930587 [Guyanagaster necrorhizus]|uniref:Uncharacterized protein n=1 Tax=Guyanagaster necrorhizus TaxID=856835 RepID=A0A9P7VXC9_9AGAR|nr:uncharacterized protein BT62DRAFT_930587 [Guyanagaster necrorhizus MCA 3950]KAG7447566.1 hypothetical protein BT62DRAFT_930587 [Guyanagaster necrorhizus MCA 3950]
MLLRISLSRFVGMGVTYQFSNPSRATIVNKYQLLQVFGDKNGVCLWILMAKAFSVIKNTAEC